MASITSLTSSSSSSSSLYGTRNVISGLASGMDTESMIENIVSGYQTKITTLTQKQTKLQWKQDSLRSMISKLSNFSTKYSSYTSSTNLMSSSFFNNAVKVTTQGANASKVSATGKTNSSVQLLGVKQLAKSATYNVSGGVLGNTGTTQSTGSDTTPAINGGKLDLSKTYDESLTSGTLKFQVGGSDTSEGKTISISFASDEYYENGEELAAAINEKLEGQDMGFSTTAEKHIQATWNESTQSIDFNTSDSAGNKVQIVAATGNLKSNFEIDTSGDDPVQSISTSGKDFVDKSKTNFTMLQDRTFSFTLDGVTKKISLADSGLTADSTAKDVADALNSKLAKAFGSTTDGQKVKVEVNSDGGLSFQTQKGSTLKIDGGEILGLDSSSETSYVNTSKKLEDLLGSNFNWENTSTMVKATGDDTSAFTKVDGSDDLYKDSDGNLVKAHSDGNYYRVNEDGEWLHSLEINDIELGTVSKSTTLEKVMTTINSNADGGVSLNYSKTTNQFQFTAKDSGAMGSVDIKKDSLAAALFGATVDTDGTRLTDLSGTYTAGQDATFAVEVNGETMEMTRSDNSFEIDGLTINLKGEFGGNYTKDSSGNITAESGVEAVSFQIESDSDTIVDAIKSMVEDYNEMVTEIKKAYSTLPLQKSDGSSYEPLTDSDQDDMSDSAISAYEEKAKTGLLFGDSDLSGLYNSLTKAVQSVGTDLESIGISVSYSDGLTTLSLNESTLRSKLDADPDSVRDVFAQTKSSGASKDGLMTALATPLKKYAATTGATKGILVQRAGSTLAPTSLYQNTIQTQIDSVQKQIEKWQDKMSDQVDFYTSKFTRLEQLISEMNSQSSTLSSLTGGY